MWTFINTKKQTKRLRVLFALVLKGLKGSNDYVHHPRCNNRTSQFLLKTTPRIVPKTKATVISGD